MENNEMQLLARMPLAFCVNEVIFDAQGQPVNYRTLKVNSALEQHFKVKAPEIVDKSVTEWLFKSQQTQAFWLVSLAGLVKSQGHKEFDEILKVNGSWYIVLAYAPSRDRLIIMFHEATRYQRAQFDLEEMQRQFMTSLETTQAFSQKIFDNSPASIIVYEVKEPGKTGDDYIVRSVNPAGLGVEGWNRDDVIGQPLATLRPGVHEFGILDAFRHVWETGETAHYPAKVYQEGEEYRWFENTIFRLPTGEIVTIYNDITEKELIHDELIMEKEKLKVTLYSIGDAVITTDVQGNVEILNSMAELYTGWKQEEAAGLYI